MFLERYGLKFNPFSMDGSAESEPSELEEVLIDYENEVKLIEEAVKSLNPPIILLVTHLGGGKTKLLRYMEKYFQKTLPNVFTTYVSMPPVRELIDFPKLIFNIMKEKTPESLKKALILKIEGLEERCRRIPRSQLELFIKEFESRVGPLEEDEKRGLSEILSVDVLSFTDALVDFIKEVLSLIFNVDRCLLLVDNFENYVLAVKDDPSTLMYLHRVLYELANRLSEDKNGVFVLGISSSAFRALRKTREESHFMSRWEGTEALQFLRGILTLNQTKELIVKYCEVAKGRKPEEVTRLQDKDIEQIINEGKIPFNMEAISLIWALTHGFPRDIVKLCHQTLEKVKKGEKHLVDEECVLGTLYAKEGLQADALENLQSYIQRVCGCTAKDADAFINETLKHYSMPLEKAASLLSPDNVELGQKYIEMLLEKNVIKKYDNNVCLSINLIRSLYKPPYEIEKPSIPIPELPSIGKIKEGFRYVLEHLLGDVFSYTLVDEGGEKPWSIISLKDENVKWNLLVYYFACEEEGDCNLHLEETRRLLVEKNCQLILGYGMLDKEKMVRILNDKEGFFKFLSSSASVLLKEQFLYIPLTLKEIDDLYLLASVGEVKRKQLMESLGNKEKFLRVKESIDLMLPKLLEKIDNIMPVYLTKTTTTALIESLQKHEVPEPYKKEVEDFLRRYGITFKEFLEKPTSFEAKLIEELPDSWVDITYVAKKIYSNTTNLTRFHLNSIANYLDILHQRGYVNKKIEDKGKVLYSASGLRKKVKLLSDELDAIKTLAGIVQFTLPSLPTVELESIDVISKKSSEIKRISEMIKEQLSSKLSSLTNYSNLLELVSLHETFSSLVGEDKLKEIFGVEYNENLQCLKNQIEKITSFEKDLKDPRKSMVEIKDKLLKLIEESKDLTSRLEKWMVLLKKLRKQKT